jgi:hypothetical protein
MKKILKYRSLIIKTLIVAAFIAYCIILSGRTYGDFVHAGILSDFEEKMITLTVGEEYDLSEDLENAKNKIGKKLFGQIDGELKIVKRENNAINLNDTVIKAISSGLGSLWLQYYYSVFDETPKDFEGGNDSNFVNLFSLKIVVIDKEENYIPVYDINDLGPLNRTYILKNDIVISERTAFNKIVDKFLGLFLNPEGYTITIDSASSLLTIFNLNFGFIDGIILKGSIVSDKTLMITFGLACFNEGIIQNCEFDIDITAKSICLFNFMKFYNNNIKGTYTVLPGENNGFEITNVFQSNGNVIDLTVTGDVNDENVHINEEIYKENTVNITIDYSQAGE